MLDADDPLVASLFVTGELERRFHYSDVVALFERKKDLDFAVLDASCDVRHDESSVFPLVVVVAPRDTEALPRDFDSSSSSPAAGSSLSLERSLSLPHELCDVLFPHPLPTHSPLFEMTG